MSTPAMKVWKNPATITPAPGNPVNVFTGGCVFAGGILQTTRLFDNVLGVLNYPYLGLRSGVSQPGPALSSDKNIGTMKALAAGKFAAMVQDQYVILTFNSQLAGVATTVLTSPGSSFRKSSNRAIGWVNTKQQVITGGWYVLNGQLVSPVFSRDFVNTETFPGTYAQPGRLTFLQTGKLPLTESYQARQD